MKFLASIIYVLFVFYTTLAAAGESITLKGIVKSIGNHNTGAFCNVALEFIDEESGKIFELYNAESLEVLHCEKEKDFIVTITAEKEKEFLFWGGNLKLNSFEILGERNSDPHRAIYISSRHHRPERLISP